MIDMTSVYLPETTEANSIRNRHTTHSSVSLEYFCNNGMQEIIPGVYLGSYSVAQLHCLGSLIERGIRYIICVRTDHEAHYIRPQINDPAITYLTLDIADKETENILRFFPEVKTFIDDALSRNSKVLVHGSSGNSRSATLVVAYVMEKYGLSVSDALRFVRTKRASVDPNAGFKAQLSEYEPIYKAHQKLINEGSSSSSAVRSKRKLDQFFENESCELNPNPPPSPVSCESNNLPQKICAPSIPTDFSSHFYKTTMSKR